MDGKEESLGTELATLSWVCMAIMFVMESHLAKQELKLKLIKKIVHLSVS